MHRPILVLLLLLSLGPAAAPASASDATQTYPTAYDRYVSPTILYPVPDALELGISPLLALHPLAPMGILDVTRSPFSADPTGRRDSTTALQHAIDYARDRQMVCYLPTGTYLISDTLRCTQNYYRRSNGYTFGAREHPCILVGAHSGRRPVIRLMDLSPGFGDPRHPKCVVRFSARKATRKGLFPDEDNPHISMNQMFIGIDIAIGIGNSGAIGIRHWAAQGSGVQDCNIDATNGYIGLQGGAGAGGGHAGITITGGRIGMDLTDADPCPVIVGIDLRGQEQALRYNGMCPLTAVGLHIVSASRGPLVTGWGSPNYPERGLLNLVDSVIEMSGGTALSVDRSLYMRNVYIKGAETIIQAPGTRSLPSAGPEWTHVREYALCLDPPPVGGTAYAMALYVNGEQLQSPVLADARPSKGPPPDLVSRHVWSPGFFWFDSPGVVDVTRPPYRARGNGIADDTAAIQRALNEHNVVLLPKGMYRITDTIHLRPGNALVGVGRHLSRLLVAPGAAHFNDADNPQPALSTANNADTDTVVANLGIHVQREAAGAFALLWRSGGRALLRDCNLYFTSRKGFDLPGDLPQCDFPLVVVAGHGGGVIHGFVREDNIRQGPGYRHLLVRDTRGPLRIYQLDAEHAQSDAQVEIRNAHNVTIYGLKTEGNHRALWVRDSERINVVGFGGKAAAFHGKTLLTFQGSRAFSVANAMEVPYASGGKRGTMFGMGLPPDQWHLLEDIPAAGPAVRTAPQIRPVLYRRD